MISKASLLTTLRQNASILSTEYDDTALNGFLDEAMLQHNRRYTFATAPSREGDAVLFLAWIKVCYARAGAATQYFSISGKSASGDKSQIMRNNLELIRELRTEYTTLCGRLGISGAPEIIVSDFTILDESLSGVTPVNSHMPPDAVTLSVYASTASSVTLEWTPCAPARDFVKYRLFFGTVAGLQDMSTMSEAGELYPGLDSTKVTLIGEYTDIFKTMAKVTGLTAGTAYYFVVAAYDNNQRISVSNEIAVTPTVTTTTTTTTTTT